MMSRSYEVISGIQKEKGTAHAVPFLQLLAYCYRIPAKKQATKHKNTHKNPTQKSVALFNFSLAVAFFGLSRRAKTAGLCFRAAIAVLGLARRAEIGTVCACRAAAGAAGAASTAGRIGMA